MVTLTKDDFIKTRKKPAFGNEDGHVAAIFLDVDDRSEPFIVLLFHAIMAFRRLIKKFMRRKYVIQISKIVRIGDNPLQIAIKASNADLVNSRGKATVMDFDTIHEALESNAAEIARKEKWERNINNYLQKKQRMKKKKANKIKSNTSTISVLKHMHHAQELQKGIETFTNALQETIVHVKHDDEHELLKKNALTLENTLLMNPKYAPPPHAEKVPRFMIADVDNINTYLPGAPIYYGATIGIQARHGGYLSYFNSSDIKASAFKPTGQARYVIINCDRREDTGLVRYGDAIWLQVGLYEILGAKFGIRKRNKVKEGEKNEHSLIPSFVNCRNDNMKRAMNYGRWIVMSKSHGLAKQGQPVCHHDHVLFEQEWYYLSSNRPSECNMFRSKAADHLNNEKELCKYLFKPAEECTWKIHILGQASEKSDKKQLEKIFSKANNQIDCTAQKISKQGPGLLSHIQTKIADHLKPEFFLVDHLKHKTDNVETQVEYYDVYQKLAEKNFSNLTGTAQFLAKVYGKNSKIAKYSKIADNYKKQKAGLEIDDDNKEIMLKTNQEVLLEDYWDTANKLLVPCASALTSKGFMDHYFALDYKKKYMAGMVIKKALMRKIASRFTFPRALCKNDHKVQGELYNQEYAKIEMHKSAEKKKAENTANYLQEYQMSAFGDDTGPLNIKRSTSPTKSVHIVTYQAELSSPSRPQTAGTSRISLTMQNVIPDYQLPVIRPKSPTNNQKESITRPSSASAISRNIITSPIHIKKQSIEETINPPKRVQSAPSNRNNNLNFINNDDNKGIEEKKETLLTSLDKKNIIKDKLVKAEKRPHGLPRDVFEGKLYDMNNTLKEKGRHIFLSRSSSTPEIYSDQKKSRGINWTRKL